MAAFIVISSDNRLHYLVDGIAKCRPLNPNVSVEISTGKISKQDTGYVYEYTLLGEDFTYEKAKFCDILSNQLAAFRLAYAVPQDELVNIFFLENPLKEEDVKETVFWLEDFNKVYHAGHGHDTSFCVYRVIFTYNHDNPNDVSTPIDSMSLNRLLENHKRAVFSNQRECEEPSFEQFLFYFDNQKSDAAALCLRKDEHDLKMPRLLIDFMMLVSNGVDKYKIIAAINPATVTTKCFSVGYAESMYYYPDVERYFIHADNRDIHNRFLISDDEQLEDDKIAMDIEKYPFGLLARQKRLSIIYKDIPFTDNISNYPASADMKINNCIIALRDFLVREREAEYENFQMSARVVECNKIIEDFELQIASIQQREDETHADFDARVEQLWEKKDKVAKELEQLKQSFEPECPIYINRIDIYNELLATDEKNKNSLLKSYSFQYKKLIDFAKSRQFYDFVKAVNEEELSSNSSGSNSITDKARTKGCSLIFKRLFSWLSTFKRRDIQNTETDNMIQSRDETTHKLNQTALECITCIIEQLDLKSRFSVFDNKIKSIEDVYESENEYCQQFKLTTHTNHYFPLINLQELKKKHAETTDLRIQASINKWRSKPQPVKEDLLRIIRDEAIKYTTNYSYIDWCNPFSFIQELSEETNMPTICNELQKRAAPMVNYNLTSATKDNKVIRCFFSDRPQFEDEFKRMRPKLNNGNEISATTSTHIASKICMFQFLPMDEDVISNLVDLQPLEEMNVEPVGKSQHLTE